MIYVSAEMLTSVQIVLRGLKVHQQRYMYQPSDTWSNKNVDILIGF